MVVTEPIEENLYNYKQFRSHLMALKRMDALNGFRLLTQTQLT
jgi:hypothetical protein